MRGDSWRPVALLVAPLLLVASLFGFAFSYRTDYLGHFLAGYGGTLGVIAVVSARSFDRRTMNGLSIRIVTATLCCIGFGAVLEATVFRIAVFDPVDFANQSLGAVLAGLSSIVFFAGAKHNAALLGSVFLIATSSLLAGFFYAFA